MGLSTPGLPAGCCEETPRVPLAILGAFAIEADRFPAMGVVDPLPI
jgi:hypothetical protein